MCEDMIVNSSVCFNTRSSLYDNREISIEALILFCAKYEADWKYFVLYNTLTL